MADRTFWRIVRTNPPTRQDFLSHAARGLPVRSQSPEVIRQSEGVSAFTTEAQARRQARRYPQLGRWLAELRTGDTDELTVERSPGGAGHHTIWGDADLLLERVVRVKGV
jgi:hypothetical protein